MKPMTLSGNEGDGERWCNPERNCHAWETEQRFQSAHCKDGVRKRRCAGRAAKEGAIIRQAVFLTGDMGAHPDYWGMVETGEC